MSNLYISTYPASYRIDLCNFLSSRCKCDIYHYVKVDKEEVLFRDASFVNNWLSVRWLGEKVVPVGLGTLVASLRPKIVFVQEFSLVTLTLLCLRKRFGFKVIALCDDSLNMIQGNDFKLTHRLARHIVPRWLDSIILHSPGVRDWYQSHFGKGLLMPIIADERRVRPALERVLPLSERLRPGMKPIVGFVGRLVGLKNVPTLIRAFAPLKERAQLVIIGDGEERALLEEMAPHALFPGYLTGDELLAWYNLIDILVLPSTQEAYGTVTGEALMAGAKVVVSRRAGSSSLVQEGKNGYLFEPLDADALTDRLEQLLETVPEARNLTLRDNLLPCRFETSIEDLIKGLYSL